MQLHSSFSTLLAGLLLAALALDVTATPLTQRNDQTVSLPLRRVERNEDVHPQIGLQQHINRGVRRLAMITGQNPPTRRSLENNLRKRMETLDSFETIERRFNRQGVPAGSTQALKAGKGGRKLEKGKKGKNGKNGNAKTPAVAAGQASTSNDQQNDVTDANPPSDSDSLGLDIEAQDVGYLATVQIGTPPRDFLLLMDSGSADFWVGAENCQSQGGGGCGNHVFLGSQSSSTFQESNNQFEVTYGTGNVQGNIITDNVAIAGLQLNQHTFGVATSESVDFSSDQTPFDGLMGLAQSSLSEQKTPTPVDSLASAGLIPDSIVSFKIPRLADNKNDGEITFGSLDPAKFDASTLVAVPNVNQDGFWEAALDSATVNGQDTGLTGRTAILDTGTTLMILPASDAAAVHQLIPGAQSDGQGGFTVPCTTTASVALTFGGQEFTIDPRDIAFQPVDANNPQGDCTSGIASGQVGGATEWLVGDVFLKNAYFSVDTSKNTVSLAKLT